MLVHSLLLAAALATSPNPTTLPAAVVPVDTSSVPAVATQQQPPAQSQTPSPAPDALAPSATTLPGSGPGWIITHLGAHIEGSLSGGMDMAVATAIVIFKYVAVISFVVNIVALYGTGADLAGLVLTSLRKVVEWTFLASIIAFTWRSPFGPGWFPAIVGGLFNIGTQIAQKISPGAPIPPTVSDTLSGMAAYPGIIADYGAALYTNILAGIPAADAFSGIPYLGITTGIVHLCIVICFWFSAVYAYANCLFVAIRYFMVYIKTMMIGLLSFIQGASASQRLSSFSSGMYTAPIVAGCEFATTIILIGCVFAWVADLSHAYMICATSSGGVCGAITGTPAITVGDLVALGIVLTFWSYCVHRVPTMVADALQGRISVNTSEMRQAMASSPFMGARMLGYGSDVLAGTSTGGVTGGAKSAFAPVGNFARNVGLGAIAGVAGGAAKGAVGGMILGGPEGAAAGALAGAVKGVISGGGKNSAGDSSDASTDEEPVGESAGQKRTDRDADTDNRDATHDEGRAGTITSAASLLRDDQGGRSTNAMGQGTGSTSSTASNSNVTSDGTIPTTGRGSEPKVDFGQPTVTSAQEAAAHLSGTSSGRTTATNQRQTTSGGTAPANDGNTGGDSTKTVTRTTNVKQQTNVDGSSDVTRALQNVAAALNANTAAIKGGGQPATSSAGGGGSMSRMAGELGMDMPIGGMLVRQALYRQARTPTPPPPVDENSHAIGGISTGIGR